MPAGPRAGCGAALPLWIVGSILCRAWTAPAASRSESHKKGTKNAGVCGFFTHLKDNNFLNLLKNIVKWIETS
ncbi:hypothetical protein VULLAG_LOCUS4257 [Vulpes lagopus]